MFFLKPINDMVNDFFNDSVFSYSYKPFRIDIKERDKNIKSSGITRSTKRRN